MPKRSVPSSPCTPRGRAAAVTKKAAGGAKKSNTSSKKTTTKKNSTEDQGRTLDAWVVRDSPDARGARSPLRCISPMRAESRSVAGGAAGSNGYGDGDDPSPAKVASAMVIEPDVDVDLVLEPVTAKEKTKARGKVAQKSKRKTPTKKKVTGRGAATPKGMNTFTRKGSKTPISTVKSTGKKKSTSLPKPVTKKASTRRKRQATTDDTPTAGLSETNGDGEPADTALSAQAALGPRTPKSAAARAPGSKPAGTPAEKLAALEAAAVAEVTKLLSGSGMIDAIEKIAGDVVAAPAEENEDASDALEARVGMGAQEDDADAVGKSVAKPTKKRGRKKAKALTVVDGVDVSSAAHSADATIETETSVAATGRPINSKKTNNNHSAKRKSGDASSLPRGKSSSTKSVNVATEKGEPRASKSIDVGADVDNVTSGGKHSKNKKRPAPSSATAESQTAASGTDALPPSTARATAKTASEKMPSRKRRKSATATDKPVSVEEKSKAAVERRGEKETNVAETASSAASAEAPPKKKRGRKRKKPIVAEEAADGGDDVETNVGADSVEVSTGNIASEKSSTQVGPNNDSVKEKKRAKKATATVAPPSPLLVTPQELARMQRIAAAGGHGWRPMPAMRAISPPQPAVEISMTADAVVDTTKIEPQSASVTENVRENDANVADHQAVEQIDPGLANSAKDLADMFKNEQELEKDTVASTTATESPSSPSSVAAEAVVDSEEEKDAPTGGASERYLLPTVVSTMEVESQAAETAEEANSTPSDSTPIQNGPSSSAEENAVEGLENADAERSVDSASNARDAAGMISGDGPTAAISSTPQAEKESARSAPEITTRLVDAGGAVAVDASNVASGDVPDATTREDSASDAVSTEAPEGSAAVVGKAEAKQTFDGAGGTEARVERDATVAEKREKQAVENETFEGQFVMVGDGCSSSGCFDCCFKAQKPCGAHAKQLERKRIEDELLAGGPSQSQLYEERRRLPKGVFKEEAIHAIGDTATVWCFTDFLCSKSNQGTFKALDRAQRATAGRQHPRFSRRASKDTPKGHKTGQRPQQLRTGSKLSASRESSEGVSSEGSTSLQSGDNSAGVPRRRRVRPVVARWRRKSAEMLQAVTAASTSSNATLSQQC